MTAIAKLVATIVKLAALFATAEAIIRLARFAWSLVLQIGTLLRKRRPAMFGRVAWAR